MAARMIGRGREVPHIAHVPHRSNVSCELLFQVRCRPSLNAPLLPVRQIPKLRFRELLLLHFICTLNPAGKLSTTLYGAGLQPQSLLCLLSTPIKHAAGSGTAQSTVVAF